MSKEEIVSNLKSKEEYLKEIKKLNNELANALYTGTLIQDEYEELVLKLYEKIAIIRYIGDEDYE